MSAYWVITLISLNNWFYPLEEFLQIIGCQEMVKATEIMQDVAFGVPGFFLFWQWTGWADLHFYHNCYLVHLKKWYIWFYLLQKKDLLVFLCRKHINWKFLYSFWPLLAQEETLSHALRVERVWHFVSVHKGNSSLYFTQAKVNDKEILICF